mgnify:FL=1
MEKRGLSSPDRAEAVMLACAPDPRSTSPLEIHRLDGADQRKSEEELTEAAKEEIENQLARGGVYWP